MDPKKAIIIGSGAAVLIGAAALAVLLIRARGLTEEPAGSLPNDEVTTTTPGGTLTGGGEPAPSADAPASATATAPDRSAPAVTTVTPAAEGAAGEDDPASECDISDDAIDCDYDRLTNAEERKYKTNPLKEDTDGDGVSDSGEVMTWKTDPLNPRSVDPSMTDLEAINAGKKNLR